MTVCLRPYRCKSTRPLTPGRDYGVSSATRRDRSDFRPGRNQPIEGTPGGRSAAEGGDHRAGQRPGPGHSPAAPLVGVN
ncbi:phage DNA packaging protein J [Actinocrispum sp. NPDC049592]|uniref:phage DNA packaging protein J n=1 Tax=Actinocrispum sp. NPDC049592 TaxID=3154835 RepID=UPI00342F5818